MITILNIDIKVIIGGLFLTVSVIMTLAFIVGIISAFVYGLILGYKWLNKKGYKLIGIALIVLTGLGIIYEVYTAIYPTDSFYLDEFKQVTLKDAPKTAVVVRKTASYPDFHGDYCSASIIKLSKQDYDKLFEELSKDQCFKRDGELISSFEFDQIMGTYKRDQIKTNFTRPIENHEDRYFYIGFLDDNQSIIVYVSVT